MLIKDGTNIFEYFTDSNGKAEIEYLDEVTIIEISKIGYSTDIEAIPHAPSEWVRGTYISLIIGIITGCLPLSIDYFRKKGSKQVSRSPSRKKHK